MISILMPVYNTSKEYLDRAVKSCLDQTFANYELVIVNNGSDRFETTSLLFSYSDHPKIRILYCERNPQKRNIALALNYGIGHIDNPFIARMDSDDIMEPERLEKQISYMQQNPDVYVLGTQIKTLFGNQISNLPKIITPQNALEAKWDWFISHPTVMIRRNLFDIVGYYDENTMIQPEDLELWYRVLGHSLKMENFDEMLLLYNDDGHTLSSTDSKDLEWKANIEKIKNRFKSKMGIFPDSHFSSDVVSIEERDQ